MACTASYEKFIMDADLLQMVAEVFQPVGAEVADLAIDTIAEVGPGGHFFGTAATRRSGTARRSTRR